jgi:hypothetical protein
MFLFINEAMESNSFINFIISQIKDRNAGLSGQKYTTNNTIRSERSVILNKYGELQVSLQFGSNECNYQILLVQGVVSRVWGGGGAGGELRDPRILLTHSSP